MARLAYAQSWDGDLPAAMAAFRAWVSRYQGSTDGGRPQLEAEGVALAKARRAEMRNMIIRTPEMALAVTVPAVVRQALPPAVLAELEARVSGTGEFALQAMSYEPGQRPAGAPSMRRIAFVSGTTYTAHAYGRRAGLLTKEGASLHGIALDGDLALHDSPLRVLEPGEIAGAEAGPNCPVSKEGVAGGIVGQPANVDTIDLVEAHGRVWQFCGGGNMLADFEARLLAAENQPGPRVAPPNVSSGTAAPSVDADAATAWTIGSKKLLVLRVDFSDFPGEPVTAQAIGDTLNNAVRSFYEEGSYGQTTLVTTVSTNVYRMPQTGAAYAQNNNSTGLHNDARTAAGADYTIGDYDRIMVVFGNLSTARVPNSQFTFGGLASVNGTSSWINNAFTMRTMAHELGHNHGLKHSSLWQVTDGNPLSPRGISREYGDPFDVMGDSSDRDARHHFNHWCKNLMGWLPDSAVTTVTTSGTYRIYRYDSKNASRTQPLALRVFRDGVRWYWIGYRQNFSSNASLSNGANILWGFNALQESQLLDLNSPGNTPLDSALAVGATLVDSVSGVRIRTVARGGDEPAQWLDVEVTVPAAPPNVVATWGGNQNFLDVPNAITYPPFDLTGVAAIAAGTSHVLALKSNGTVTAWGDNVFAQATVPTISDIVTSIAAGGNYSGAVKRDGTIQLWGSVTNGVTTPPAGLSDVRQLSIGFSHALALKNDGTVVAWGSNSSGQTNVPAGLTNVVAVAAGDRVSAALKADGTVSPWGITGSAPFPQGLSGVVSISASGSHFLALKSDGTVVAWGNNANTQSNVPAGLANVVAVAAGEFHSLALKADGTIVAWGSGASGKLLVPPSLPRATAIEASGQASFALIGSSVFITTQPSNQTIAAGGTAVFSVAATGTGALTYQWRKDGVAIPGATATTYSVTGASAANVGVYDVVVRDAVGTQTTFGARLTLSVAPGDVPSRIANLSILTSLSGIGDSFTMGYVVGGTGTSGPKPLVIRAVGPSLGALGVPGTLRDPRLELYAGATRTGENDDWGGSSATATAMAAVGAFPFVSPTSFDAATLADISTRDNSVKVSAFGSTAAATTGTVIAEIYDASPIVTFGPTTPRLLNVSVLKNIGTSLTAGFVIRGPSRKRVLIRAVGPTLNSAFGISGVVANPQLVLFRSSAQIGSNDNWGGTAELAAAFTAVGAFALAPTSQDAALLAELEPADYSVVVTGVGGATGIALVEVYDVP
ncbi:MAG TPA: hypothetical protein VM029_17305 [Opitutaceae bacterium]|nr:hypothetical protein [Opitutaceae bacterium]